MKVLLAGATGAIGQPLVQALREVGHDVVGLTRDSRRARVLLEAGVEPVVGDALDRDTLLHATHGLCFDAVIHEMTALSKPPARHGAMAGTNRLRTVGTRNLLAVARRAGATRFVTQSIVFGYGYFDHGAVELSERSPFGELRGGPTDVHVDAMRENEELVISDESLAGIALRYGLFYGGDVASMREMLTGRKIPVPRSGERQLAWIHLEDAVSATVAALEHGLPRAAYNIVDDAPVSWRDLFVRTAEALGAPAPRQLPDWLIRSAAPYVGAMLSTSMRVSNARAREQLGWAPSYPTYRDGLQALRVP
jgi:nucleoside-diphosphate-sugar epimerase